MIRKGSLLLLLSMACLSLRAAAEPVQKTAELLDIIAPAKSEQAWLQIPWETDLAAARRKAAAQDKPVFLWEMDGHPLGCT
ncbi:MAG TPA: hypothetical protein VG796_30200 [Verrucomicrobiales bacterium]|jgi:hypothetical protein|nr:hypothetical protein [Verrucomicrobiales bacterium]